MNACEIIFNSVLIAGEFALAVLVVALFQIWLEKWRRRRK